MVLFYVHVSRSGSIECGLVRFVPHSTEVVTIIYIGYCI